MIRSRAARLRADESGAAAIEFSIVVPIIILMLLGAVTFFVAHRNDYRAKRATYTITDIISRQNSVNDSFLATQKEMFTKLAQTAATAGIRVTSVSRSQLLLAVDWSYVNGGSLVAMKNADLLTANLPNVPIGSSVLLVDTAAPYTPLFSMFGSETGWRNNTAIARPRSGVAITKTK